MEPRSETSRSPVSKGLVLAAVSSLALAAASKNTTAQQTDRDPVRIHHDMSLAQADHTHDPTLPEYCADSTLNRHGKEKIQAEIFSFFIGKRFSAAQAAGIDGNFGQESDWNTSDTGGFLAQWGGDRLLAFERFAKRHDMSPTNPQAQFSYVWAELTDGPGAGEDDRKVLEDLRATNTAQERLPFLVTNTSDRVIRCCRTALSTPSRYCISSVVRLVPHVPKLRLGLLYLNLRNKFVQALVPAHFHAIQRSSRLRCGLGDFDAYGQLGLTVLSC
jgi:hypothetical protein